MASNRTIFTYRDPWGSEHELALVRTIYQMTGNLAVEALVADRGDEEYGQTWWKRSIPWESMSTRAERRDPATASIRWSGSRRTPWGP